MKPPVFPAFGVEIESMIVDRGSLDVRPFADRVLRDADGTVVNNLRRGPVTWSNELVAHVLEFKVSAPAPSLEGVGDAIHASMLEASARLAPHGAGLLGGGMHPWFDPSRETVLWPHEDREIYQAFDRIFDCRGHGWSNLQSFHLNLPFAGDEGFRRLHSAVRLVLPLVPALAAASPFVDGRPTGRLDTRIGVYRSNSERLPVVNGGVIPEVIRSEQEYRERIFAPIAAVLAPLDPDRVLEPEWTNARGAIARFDRGTIEVRLGDAQECPRMDLAVISAIASLVAGWIDETESPLAAQESVGTGALSDLLDRVARQGRHADIVDPAMLAALGETAPLTVGSALRKRLARLGALGPEVARILDHGSLAERILAAVGTAPDRIALGETYRRVAECLVENRPFPPS